MRVTTLSITAFKQGKPIPLVGSLTIALIKANDLGDIIYMLNDPKVSEFLFFAPAPVEVYQGFFNPIIENTAEAMSKGEWPENITVVIRDLGGNYMGMAGLPAVMFLPGNFEVGYQLPVHAWGQGIATAACQFLTKLAFTELGAHKVTADCYLSNAGSYKTMQKCGYVHEGTQKDYYKLGEGFDDRVHYGLTKAQYSAR